KRKEKGERETHTIESQIPKPASSRPLLRPRVDPSTGDVLGLPVGIAVMNPEMLRVAEEQMRRIPADDLARMQRQLMSSPDLLKLATESMKNMMADDFKRAAEHLNHARPAETLEVTEKIAKAKPEELAAMKAQADAQTASAISAAKMLKRQGNQFHGLQVQARQGYSVKSSVLSAAGRALQL
uniref:Uncharacterized protein n=1 Tax=Aegilops tauschii subsp. strangulata TaxID=200361 RepID=A0A453R0L6_AEGTS